MNQTAEQIASWQLIEIFDKLELIPEMDSYENVYRALSENSMSGRHVLEVWREHAVEHPFFFREKRFAQFKSYRDYPYMEKRWQKYQKKKNLQDISWQQVMDLCLAFSEPIWQCVCNEEVFFQDWMPELGRFLD